MPTEVTFTPDDKVRIHEIGAIRHICAPFRSHEAGLPEWIKNSSDAYARNDVLPSEACIFILFKDGKADSQSVIGCLDFGGMTTSDIETKFRQWADPGAAGEDDGVEGGHGNGGKCYMTQLFEDYSYLHTVSDGRGNKYGFKGGSATPGYFPSPEKSRGYKADNAEAELASALKIFDLKLHQLPDIAKKLFEKRKSFTLAMGVGAKNLNRNKIPATKWIENLRGHQQMVHAIQRNQIFVYHNGQPVVDAGPLKLDDIRPIPGAEAPRVIQVPPILIHPDTGEEIPTGAVEGDSYLELRTSETSMRYSLKARHTINGWTNKRRSTGYWEVPELSRATYAHKIYGDLYLDALADYKQNDRKNR